VRLTCQVNTCRKARRGLDSPVRQPLAISQNRQIPSGVITGACTAHKFDNLTSVGFLALRDSDNNVDWKLFQHLGAPRQSARDKTMEFGEKTESPTERRITELLELFYPVHYKTGIAFEDAMRGDKLTRKQTAILWLIHSEGTDRRQMRRKAIERSLQTWFEVSSSAITKALRGMSRPPLNLVRIIEDSESAREKQVVLTSKGEKFLEMMVAEGRRLIRQLVGQLTEQEVDGGIVYLRKATAVLQSTIGEPPARARSTNGLETEA
jgi:DNA-binding MarR family transcriptional regulator